MIDDIKIYGTNNNTVDSDFDNDGISNWMEYYWFKSSMFEIDMDNDSLDDFYELNNDTLNEIGMEILWGYGPSDPCRRDIFIEIDSMLSENGTEVILNDVIIEGMEKVAESFYNHHICLHLQYDQVETTNAISFMSNVYVNDDAQSNRSDDLIMANWNHGGEYYYLVFVWELTDDGGEGSLNGRNDETCAFLLSGDSIYYEFQHYNSTSRGSNFTGRLMMHEMGHSHGMLHTYGYHESWDPYWPGYSAMFKSTSMPFIWYYGEDSDREFSYNGGHYFHDTVLCGWQYTRNAYAHEYTVQYRCGLNYEIIKYWDCWIP